MLITAIISCALSLLATVYCLIRYIFCYKAVNSVDFVQVAQNPYLGAEAMKELMMYRNALIIMIAVTVLLVVLFVGLAYMKKKVIPNLKNKIKTTNKGHAITRCHNCGAEVSSGLPFCTNCGTKF